MSSSVENDAKNKENDGKNKSIDTDAIGYISKKLLRVEIHDMFTGRIKKPCSLAKE